MTLLEGMHLEWKAAYVPEIKKEVIAFANSQGGTICIGIADNGEVLGVEDADRIMQQAGNIIRDAIRPDVSMFTMISVVQKEGKPIVEITVERGTNRPYYLYEKGLKPSGVYVRQGSSSVPASEEAIRKMIRETDGESFERNRSLSQELTFQYMSQEMQKRGLEFGMAQQRNLGLIGEDGLYTNLGLLLSEQCVHSIKLAVFQGNDKRIFRERKEFHGSLLQQLKEVYETINFYNRTQATFIGLERVDHRDYPPEAIREALLNAIVHREYSFSGSTLVNIYENQIEFLSLGGLVPGLSMEAVLMGVSQSRNEKLAGVFYRMQLIEAYGTGISKILRFYEGKEPQPEFASVDGAFRVVLPNLQYDLDQKKEYTKINHREKDKKAMDTLSEQHRRILSLAQQQGQLTRRDIEKHLQISTSRSIGLLKEMTEAELLLKEGKGRNTIYRPYTVNDGSK